MVLLLAFQVLCGSVYHQIGIIVTVFMAGLALGASVSTSGCMTAATLPVADAVFGLGTVYP